MSNRPATLVLLDRFLATSPVDAALERIEEALWGLVGWSETLRSALVDQESTEVLAGAFLARCCVMPRTRRPNGRSKRPLARSRG